VQTTIPSRVITGFALPRSAAVTAALVVGFALFTALSAQIAIPLPFTPVPISGQTFAVLLAGAALGSTAGPASQALYLGLGIVGFPFFAEGESGWSVMTGSTGGYLVGFVVAAFVVGVLAERRQDRDVITAIPAFLLGTVIIYVFGLTWLAYWGDFGWTQTAEFGLIPFIPGDLVKIVLAGVLLPTAWRIAALRRR
jgi:biotin transport system substrate-specific component